MKPSFYFWRGVAAGFERYGDYLAKRILTKFGVPGRVATNHFRSVYDRWGTSEALADPEGFFESFRRERTKLIEISGSSHLRISFPSPFFSGNGQNDLVKANLYTSPKHSSDTVVIWLGGLFVNFNPIDQLIARYLFSHGVDVCSMALPYHGPRACYERSGVGFISTEPLAVGEAFIQAVLDVTKLHQILAENFGYKEVFGAGISVSGNILHVASFIKEFSGLVLITSGVSLAEIFWFSPSPYFRAVRHVLEANSCTLERLKRLWMMSDGTEFKVKPRCSRFLMATGLFDNYAKPEFALCLFRSLRDSGEAEMVVYPGSHYDNIFFVRPVFRNIKRLIGGQLIIQTKWRLE